MLILIAILVGTVSAVTWDNAKSYNKNTKTITIKNNFGIPLLESKVAEIKLNTPTIYNVIRGQNRLVAEFTITNYQEEYAFNNLRFYDLKNKNKRTDRTFTYRYKDYENVLVNDYERVCDHSTKVEEIDVGDRILKVVASPNKTAEEMNCRTEIAGNHIEQKVIWKDFDYNDKLPLGEITIGIFTDVYPNDYIEWIPTLFGVRINEWAIWLDSYSKDLLAYFKLDELSGDEVADVRGLHNGTRYNMEDIDWKSAVINNGLNFNGSGGGHGEYVNFTDIGDKTYNLTICGWMNSTNVAGEDLFIKGSNAAGHSFSFGLSATKLRLNVWASVDDTNLFGNQVINDGLFHHVCMVKNDTTTMIYVNGSQDGKLANAGSIDSSAGANFTIGRYFEGTTYFNGTVDEVGMWNRSLTDTEINSLWNNGFGLQYNRTISTNLNYPADDHDSIGLVTVNCSVDSAYLVANITLQHNATGTWHNNQTNSTINPVTNESTFVLVMPSYTVTWDCFACDVDGTCDSAGENRTINKVKFAEINQDYQSDTLEGTTESFNLTGEYDTDFSIYSNLYYNGSWYTGTSSASGNNISFSASLSVPQVTAHSNMTFFWNVTLVNATNTYSYNSSALNQTVYNFALDDCSANTVLLYNFTLNEEELATAINGVDLNSSMEIELYLSSFGTTNKFANFSQNYTHINPATVCSSTNFKNSTYRADYVIKFEADNHIEEFYYMDNETLTNSSLPRQVQLYDLNTTDSTSFLTTFKDSSYVLIEDAVISVLRKYVADGIFREVERVKTNNYGEAILHLVEEDVVYKFNVTLNNEVLWTSTEYTVYCAAATTCELELEAAGEVPSFPTDWDQVPEGTWSVKENQTTRDVTLTFNLNKTALMNISVYKYSNNQSEADTLIGTSSINATNGNLIVNVPTSYGNATYYAYVYKDNQWIGYVWLKLKERVIDYLGYTGVFMGGLMVLTLMLMAVGGGVIAIVAGIIGMIFATYLGLMDIGYVTLVWFICAAIIIIIKIGMRRSRD